MIYNITPVPKPRQTRSDKFNQRPEQAAVMRNNHTSGKFKWSEERRLASSLALKERIKLNGHPKGMLGKKHSEESKVVIGEASKKFWSNATDDIIYARTRKSAETMKKNGSHPKNRSTCTWKAGWREFGGKRNYYRSKWEANYGMYLEWLKSLGQITEWEHEPDTFWFNGIKRGCVSYLPDFKVTTNNGLTEYHEVKGWMDSKSKTKIKRMGIYYPNTNLIVIATKEYKEILKKVSAIVPGWEK